MTVDALDHYTLRTADLDAAVDFYVEVLGLRNGERPAFAFPGAWLYCGDAPVVHLVGVEGEVEAGTGPIDHIAFRASDLDAYAKRLTERSIPFERRQVPGRPLRQLFLTDPNGVRIELNFWDE